MKDMIEVKTSELIGPALDWAVAKCDGWFAHLGIDGNIHRSAVPSSVGPEYAAYGMSRVFSPSTNWSDGGPLIEKHTLRVAPHVQSNGVITSWAADMTWPCSTMPGQCGKTPLVAACRAIVVKEWGYSVMVPKGLVQ